MLADFIGVTYQQAHKHETGTNRIAAARLLLLRKFSGSVGDFFESLEGHALSDLAVQERVFLDLARNFRSLRIPEHQQAISLLTRILANLESGSDERDHGGG